MINGKFQNTVVKICHRISQRLTNIFLFQLRLLPEQFIPVGICGDKLDNPPDCETYSPDAGLPAHLVWIDGDSIKFYHCFASFISLYCSNAICFQKFCKKCSFFCIFRGPSREIQFAPILKSESDFLFYCKYLDFLP